MLALRHYSHHASRSSFWHYTRDEFICSEVISVRDIFNVAHGYYICIRESLCITCWNDRDIRLNEVTKWWIFMFIKRHDDAADVLGDEVHTLTSHPVWCSEFAICVRARIPRCIVRASWSYCSSLTAIKHVELSPFWTEKLLNPERYFFKYFPTCMFLDWHVFWKSETRRVIIYILLNNHHAYLSWTKSRILFNPD